MVDSYSSDEKPCEEISSDLDSSSQSNQESIIDWFLDIINIKKLIKIIFSKTPIKVTDSFISGFILLIFLVWLYISDDFFSRMIILFVLVIFLCLELLVKNVDKLKSILFNEDNNKTLLDNLHKYSIDEIERQTRIRDFTSSNVNHYLNKIKKDPSSEYGFVLENILSYSNLSIDNFNILFSEEFLKLNFLRDEIVIRILMRYKDALSQKNLLNLYHHFNNNEKIHKFMFATQIQSEFLVNENSQLKKYYKKFQSEKSLEFSELKRELPNLVTDQQKLLSKLTMPGVIGWGCLTYISFNYLNSQGNFFLPNGYINPSFSVIFLIIFLGISLFMLGWIYVSWRFFSEKLWKKWDLFMSFVNNYNE